MEIIEKMPNEEYGAICDAGVELVRELTEVLRRRGIGREHAFNVLVVAAAGVAAVSDLTADDLAAGVDSVIHMWRVKDEGGDRVAVFDPNRIPPSIPASDTPTAN